jgi:hypothetical protein
MCDIIALELLYSVSLSFFLGCADVLIGENLFLKHKTPWIWRISTYGSAKTYRIVYKDSIRIVN